MGYSHNSNVRDVAIIIVVMSNPGNSYLVGHTVSSSINRKGGDFILYIIAVQFQRVEMGSLCLVCT